jgi:hypothetical protein
MGLFIFVENHGSWSKLILWEPPILILNTPILYPLVISLKNRVQPHNIGQNVKTGVT